MMGRTVSDEEHDLAEKVRYIIVRKYRYRDVDYSASALARDLDVTPARLSGILKRHFGENYSSLVNRCRVRDAKRYLLDSRKSAYTVDDIAVMVGFSNRQSFFSAFKRFTGTTPDKWRKNT
ncbi:MAG: helix-turn-helix domain-containing protein [Bacteroides sp.]|nr:helix-turn-helix domain-containing protein [Roseburia sp.]MCM1346817.1 helix-turn-helix domain-containing protein [Bacteroides sp.]MCM1421369.1 helix-turn-helix domain-containing protein [Bacteroides sp.]